jgi:hypothetical protein
MRPNIYIKKNKFSKVNFLVIENGYILKDEDD